MNKKYTTTAVVLFCTTMAARWATHPEIEVVGWAKGADGAVRLAVGLVPDVVLMDATLPEGSGFRAARKIRSACRRIRVLFLDDVPAVGRFRVGIFGTTARQQGEHQAKKQPKGISHVVIDHLKRFLQGSQRQIGRDIIRKRGTGDLILWLSFFFPFSGNPGIEIQGTLSPTICPVKCTQRAPLSLLFETNDACSDTESAFIRLNVVSQII